MNGSVGGFVRSGGVVTPEERWRDEIVFAEAALVGLKAAFDEFELQLGAGDARVYRLPPVRDDGVASPGVTPAEQRHIPVDPISGPAALRLAKGIYKQIIRRHRQPPTRPDRLPGLVVTPHLQAIAAARAVNQAKDQLKRAMSALPRMSSRNSTLFDGTDLQHLMLLQAYRHIDILPATPDKISFGWTRRSRVVRQITREQAIDLVSGMDNDGDGDTASRWLRALRSIDDEVLAQVKDIPPTPVCNVRYTDPEGYARWTRRPSCTMPLLIPGQCLPPLQPLTTFDADQIDAANRGPDGTLIEPLRGDASLLDEPLIGAINLYRYKPECMASALTRRSARLGDAPAKASTDRAHPFD